MKFKSLSAILLSSLLLASCGNGSSDSDSKSENKKDTTSDNQVISINKIKTSPDDAIKKAQETYNNQDLKGISYEKSNGEWAYKIEQQGDNKESEVIISDKNKKS